MQQIGTDMAIATIAEQMPREQQALPRRAQTRSPQYVCDNR
jgi:hypothetical protein